MVRNNKGPEEPQQEHKYALYRLTNETFSIDIVYLCYDFVVVILVATLNISHN